MGQGGATKGTLQWRFQDLPEVGKPTLLGAPIYDIAKNFPKTAWNWKNLDPGGASKISLYRSVTTLPLSIRFSGGSRTRYGDIKSVRLPTVIIFFLTFHFQRNRRHAPSPPTLVPTLRFVCDGNGLWWLFRPTGSSAYLQYPVKE